MKTRILLLFLVLLVIAPFNLIAQKNHDLNSFENGFNNILHNLDSIISNSQNQNKLVKQHFDFVKFKILNEELPVVYDTNLTYDFAGCSSFGVSKEDNKKVNISLGPYFLDKYKNYPTLSYAILINAFQLGYDYYNNQELFLISLDNHIERLYFEMDAITLEALFLNTYFKDKNSFGYLEKYLSADLLNDMNSSSTLFYKTDLTLLHKLDNLKSKDDGSKKLLKEFEKIGNELLKNTSFKDKSDWDKYCLLVSLRTYVFYSKQIVFDIVHVKDNISMESFNFENYPAILKTLNDMKIIVNENDMYFNYQAETIKLFGDYYKNN
jgi:hypothetical protein